MSSKDSKQGKLLLLAVKKGYKVTEDGRAIGPSGREVARKCRRGYMEFWLKGGEIGNGNVPVHRIQAYQKYGDALFTPGLEVRHLDNNRLNNAASNIAIGTHSENMMDRPEEERKKYSWGAVSFRRLLTDRQVEQLRQDREKGISYKKLMEKYGIAKSTVSYIVNRKTYCAVGESGRPRLAHNQEIVDSNSTGATKK